jgi:exonuclease III
MDSITPIKRHCLANWIKKEALTICCLQETHLIDRNKTDLVWKAGRRFIKPMTPKTDRGSNTYIRQNRLQTYIGQMRQRRILHTNKRVNTSKGNNNCQPICTQCQWTQFHQTYTKGLIDSNTVVVEDFNTPLSLIDRSVKQIINKEILKLNDTIDQMDLTDVYRIFYLTTAQYTFLTTVHGTLSR